MTCIDLLPTPCTGIIFAPYSVKHSKLEEPLKVNKASSIQSPSNVAIRLCVGLSTTRLRGPQRDSKPQEHVRQYTILHSSFLPDLLAKLSVSGSHARLERTNIPCFQDMAAFCWPLFLGRRLPCKFEFATPTQQAGCRDPAQRFFTAPFMFEFLCLIAVLLRHALRTA